jgi:hypothetical protein
MLNIFKPPAPDAQTRVTKASARGTPAQAKKAPSLADPLPVPEVVEGNEDSDWALWEDSVAFQDSQMPSDYGALTPSAQRESTKAKPSEEMDPFESLRRRAP